MIAQLLAPRAGVKEASQSTAFVINDTAQEVTWVIWIRRRLKFHVAVPRVSSQLGHGRWAGDIFGHEAQPVEDRRHALLVISHHLMGHTIGHHDLRTTQLILRGVDIPGSSQGDFGAWKNQVRKV